jgi:hypothetical protein
MAQWKRALLFSAPVFVAAGAIAITANGVQAQDTGEEATFPQGVHYLLPPPSPILSDPERSWGTERVAYGAVGSEGVLPQPIAYSHKLHAGTLKIECEYCHFNARRSSHAGVPPTETCMNCHANVPGVEVPGKKPGVTECTPTLGADGKPVRSTEATAALMTLCDYHTKGEPVPWVKVHDLPDFVYFTHKRHVRGGVACQECHGQVQDDMTVAYRVGELTMGWCLNCHEDHPKVDENYGARAELRRAEMKDCWTCHK